jgi:hypothetical protein
MLNLYKFGGSFEITNITKGDYYHTYSIKSPQTAALVEEFLVSCPTKVLKARNDSLLLLLYSEGYNGKSAL